MKPWRKWLSYLTVVTVERTTSDLHSQLVVSMINGRYQLSTSNSIYSFDDLYLNFRKAFQRLILPPNGSRVLVLGLGLGSIPWMLERTFGKKYHYTLVELDEEVVRLASKYRLKDLLSPTEVVCADAVKFIQLDQSKYDLICIDVFVDDVVPDSLGQAENIILFRERLKGGGLLLWNHLFRTATDKQATRNFYENKFKGIFGSQSRYLDVDGNWILVWEA